MESCVLSEQQYIWKNGRFIEREQAVTSVLTHGLHYGSAVFEGIRAYDTTKGTAILKLKEHMARFQYSMNALAMPCPYSLDQLCQAVIDTVNKNPFKACYIRPLAYFSEGDIAVLPKVDHPVDIIIACFPMGRYLAADSIDMMVSKYIRIHPKSTVCDAKISGHYVNSILASMETRGTHYHEALLLDASGNVAEGAVQNVFIVKNNHLMTTPLGTILNGITRQLIMEIAESAAIAVDEGYFTPEEVIEADEAFCTGTAVEIASIASLNDRPIGGHGKVGKVTQLILKNFNKITSGQTAIGALTYVDNSQVL